MVGIHLYTYFNPRSREGSDGMVRSLKKRYAIFQSTLPRGERQKVQKQLISEIYHFNPRSREGSDLKCYITQTIFSTFQSTLPRGERLYRQSTSCYTGHFNPRSREGSDRVWHFAKTPIQHISIHAPARGATRNCLCKERRKKISIHAPARGATSLIA